MRFEVPLPADLVEELVTFWTSIFGDIDPDLPPEVFLGRENDHNRGTLYLDRRDGTLAGTCVLMVSRRVPILGGFGEVATSPQLRRSGIATRLCQQAVDQFRAANPIVRVDIHKTWLPSIADDRAVRPRISRGRGIASRYFKGRIKISGRGQARIGEGRSCPSIYFGARCN